MGITALQLREILEKLVELAKNYVFCEENDTVDEAEKERDALYAFNDTLLKCNIEIDINDLLCNIAEDGASFDLDDYFYYLFEELIESDEEEISEECKSEIDESKNVTEATIHVSEENNYDSNNTVETDIVDDKLKEIKEKLFEKAPKDAEELFKKICAIVAFQDNEKESGKECFEVSEDGVAIVDVVDMAKDYSSYFCSATKYWHSEEELYNHIKDILDKEKNVTIDAKLAEMVITNSVYSNSITPKFEKVTVIDDETGEEETIDKEIPPEKVIREYAEKKVKRNLFRKPDLSEGEEYTDNNFSALIRENISSLVNESFTDNGEKKVHKDSVNEFIYDILKKIKKNDYAYNSYIGYSDAVEEHHEAGLKMKFDKSELTGYPEDGYSIISGLSNFGAKGKLMDRLCVMFNQLKEQNYDVFIDLFSGSATVGCNENTGAKYVICNDLNGLAMVGAKMLSKGSEYFLEKIPEIVDEFFGMTKCFRQWNVAVAPIILFESVHKILNDFFVVREIKNTYKDKANNNGEFVLSNKKTNRVLLTKSVDELHSAFVDLMKVEEISSTKNAEVIKCLFTIIQELEDEETYRDLSFNESLIPIKYRDEIDLGKKPKDVAKNNAELEEKLNLYKNKIIRLHDLRELLLECYLPFSRILFDTCTSLHYNGKSQLLIRENPLNLKEYWALDEMSIFTDEYYTCQKESKAYPEGLNKWMKLRNFRPFECFYSIPVNIATKIYSSEISIVSMYLYRISASHMNAGSDFSKDKFLNFLNSYYEIKHAVNSVKLVNDGTTSEEYSDEVRKKIVNLLSSAFKHRFRRLYNFAFKFGEKNTHFTCFSYEVIIEEVIPKLLEKGLKVLCYVDPPYLNTAQLYASGMGRKEHYDLIKKLNAIDNSNFAAIISLNEESIVDYEMLNELRCLEEDSASSWEHYCMGRIAYASGHGKESDEYIFAKVPIEFKAEPCKVKNIFNTVFQIPKDKVSLPDSEKFVNDYLFYEYPMPEEITKEFEDALNELNKSNKRKSSYKIYPVPKNGSSDFEYELPYNRQDTMLRKVEWSTILNFYNPDKDE